MTNLADRVLDCFPAGNLAIGALLRLLDIVWDAWTGARQVLAGGAP